MKKILITGGCGFIGSNLSVYLNKKNFKIETIDNLSRKGSYLNFKRLKKLNIKNYKINIQDLNKILKLPKYDYIIDCSALVEVNVKLKNIKKVFNINFLGTNNLLMKAIRDKSKLIFMSTSRVYSIDKIKKIFKNKNTISKKIKNRKKFTIDENFSISPPISYYGLSKKFSEQLIEEYSNSFNLKYIINRFGVVSGPWQFGKVEQGFLSLWIWKHLRTQKLDYKGFGGKGFQVRDVLHVEDLCKLIFLQINKFNIYNNNIFNVGGGLKNAIDLKELTKIAQIITKNHIKIGKSNKTDIKDIPIYISNNKKVSKIYKWKPLKSVNEIALDVYKWQTKNLKNLIKYIS